MEILFFDTSALVKRYAEEPGSQRVDELIESDRTVAISSLAIIETVSAFKRKHNREQLTESRMNRLLGLFFKEALEEFVIIPIEESIVSFSFELVLENDLRTLDSLQLSAALSVDSDDTAVRFISADTELTAAATARGLSVESPTE